MHDDICPGEVILEFVQIGALIRASAMEPKSLTEVVIFGPASAGEAVLRRAVLRKLKYVLGCPSTGRQQDGKSVVSR